MDDIIVIIILVALSVIGAVTRSKKKKENAGSSNPSGVQRKSPDFWESLFEDNQTESEEIIVEDNMMYVQEPIIVEPKQNTTSKLFEEGSPKRKDKILQDEIKKDEIGKSGKQKIILEGFSLKKAIVFSEIINQKYF